MTRLEKLQREIDALFDPNVSDEELRSMGYFGRDVTAHMKKYAEEHREKIRETKREHMRRKRERMRRYKEIITAPVYDCRKRLAS